MFLTTMTAKFLEDSGFYLSKIYLFSKLWFS